ncbi:MAG: short chain dehydrogenase, partial [Gaiellales bacterium]|nr:short chain dehydrogenase [Gaiellales bacterium]
MVNRMTSSRLQGRRAFITGAGGGLTAEIARAFSREGALLVLAGKTLARVQVVADGIAAAGGSAQAVSLDVQDVAAVAACVTAAHA